MLGALVCLTVLVGFVALALLLVSATELVQLHDRRTESMMRWSAGILGAVGLAAAFALVLSLPVVHA